MSIVTYRPQTLWGKRELLLRDTDPGSHWETDNDPWKVKRERGDDERSSLGQEGRKHKSQPKYAKLISWITLLKKSRYYKRLHTKRGVM